MRATRLWIAVSCLFAFQSCATRYGEFESAARAKAAEGSTHRFAKPGFAVFEVDGRLWVFKSDQTDAINEFAKSGELAKSVTHVGGGPDGMTIKAYDDKTIQAYDAAPAR